MGQLNHQSKEWKELVDELKEKVKKDIEIRKLVDKTDDDRLEKLAKNLDTPYMLTDKERSWNEVIGKSVSYKSLEIVDILPNC